MRRALVHRLFCRVGVAALLSLALLVMGLVGAAQSDGVIYVVPLDGDIAPGFSEFLRRAMGEARQGGAGALMIEISTFGGRVDAAVEMAELIAESRIPVVVFVKGRALSAGALIALAADHLVMAPGSVIGAAQPEPADPKTISALRAIFMSFAEKRERDPQFAAAMVDAGVEVEGHVRSGEILTLTARAAQDVGYADALASTREEAARLLGYEDARFVAVTMNWAERVAQFITSPYVSSLLLTVGFTGIVMEVMSPGWGVPGTMGVAALALFFGGRMVVGLAGWGIVLLFLVGLALLAAEAFVIPGFGIAGASGLVVTFLSIGLSFADSQQALYSILAALVLTVVLVVALFRYLPRSGAWGRLILETSESRESGYVGPARMDDHVGKTGIALTPLRPSGTIDVGGVRLDVTTEGGFVPAGTRVEVMKAEAMRLVVRVRSENNEKG